MQFLMGLEEYYDSVRTHILSSDPIPKINKAFYMVCQAESQKGGAAGVNTPSSESMALAANKQAGYQGNSSYKQVGNSSYQNDSAGNQYKKSYQGRDESKGYQGRNDKFDKANKKCNHCHQKDHFKDQCLKLHDIQIGTQV